MKVQLENLRGEVKEFDAVEQVYANRSICDCGHPVLKESVPIGKTYLTLPETRGTGTYICGGCHKTSRVEMIQCHDDRGLWLPLPVGIFRAD